jgi:histidinol dehydrogenase
MKLIRTKGRAAQQTAEILAALEDRGGAALDAVLPAVKRIVADVRKQGDRALLRYAAQFDGLAGADVLRVTPNEMAAAWDGLTPAMRKALTIAADQIRAFAVAQLPASWSESPIPGLTTGQLVRPLGSVGCYVPSGRHPLPSTLLMTAIPAQVAGVERIAVVSPKPAPETLAAAHLLGITEFYRLGGAHAIAALAYGTAAIKRVDKIVGPGNLYVTAAKRLVAFDCAIDMLAGPTEIVVTSERGHADEIAYDIVAQAEHDPEALAIFITTRADLAKAVIAEAKLRSRNNAVAREALDRNGLVILASKRRRSACDHQSPCRRAPHRGRSKRSRLGAKCGIGFCGPLERAADGRLHLRPQSHAAHRRHGAGARRPERQRLRQAHHRPRVHCKGNPLSRSAGRIAGRGRRPHRPRPSDSHTLCKEENSWLKPSN